MSCRIGSHLNRSLIRECLKICEAMPASDQYQAPLSRTSCKCLAASLSIPQSPGLEVRRIGENLGTSHVQVVWSPFVLTNAEQIYDAIHLLSPAAHLNWQLTTTGCQQVQSVRSSNNCHQYCNKNVQKHTKTLFLILELRSFCVLHGILVLLCFNKWQIPHTHQLRTEFIACWHMHDNKPALQRWHQELRCFWGLVLRIWVLCEALGSGPSILLALLLPPRSRGSNWSSFQMGALLDTCTFRLHESNVPGSLHRSNARP